MSTLMEEKMKEAIDKKALDINSFVWKGSKSLDENGKYKQSEKRLVDMNIEELRKCYDHCKTMLFNKDSQNPGRYIVIKNISDQKDRCGTELLVRYLLQKMEIKRYTLMTIITEFLNNNREVFKTKKPVIDDLFNGIPSEFGDISLSLVQDACLDRLGAFNKKHITRTFILKQGIWLTPSEVKDLTETDEEGNPKDRISLIREKLGIKEIEKLYINSKGINYTQMKSMLTLKANQKYMDFSSTQLEVLRSKMLFVLEEDVKSHILAWEKRMSEIEQVVENKGLKL